MRFVTSLAAAVVCATLAVHAQESTTKTKTKVEGKDASKTVTYTGCLGAGTETQTFVLNKVVPVGQTTETTTDASGTTSATTTSYALMPSDTVQITEYVGHKVEVTGVLVPKGEMTAKTKTKVGEDTQKAEVKTESDLPQFRVVSIRNVAERCE